MHPNSQFDRCPISALRNLADMNGVGRDLLSNLNDNIDIDDPVTKQRLHNTCSAQIIDDAKKQQILTDAIKTYSGKMKIKACGSCGHEDLDPEPKDCDFVTLRLTDEIAARLAVDQTLLTSWFELQARASAAPPIVLGPVGMDEIPPTVSVQDVVRTAFNYVELPAGSGNFFHLHKTLLHPFEPHTPRCEVRFEACKSCAANLNNKIRPAGGEFIAPRFSLKDGFDYGRYAELVQLGLPELSIPEIQLISPARVMAVIIKLVADGGAASESNIACLKGHCIVFPHTSIEALESAKVLPNFEALTSEFNFCFIGKREQWAKMRATGRLQQSQCFRIDTWRILAWLRALHWISDLPAFKRVEPVLDAKTMERLAELPEQLIDSVSVMESSVTIGIEHKKSSDIAMVRNKLEEPDLSDAAVSEETGKKLESELPAGSCLLEGILLQNSGEIQKSHALTGVVRAATSILDTISATAGEAGNSIRKSAKQNRSGASREDVANVQGAIAGSLSAASLDDAAENATAGSKKIAAEAAAKTHVIKRGNEPISEFGQMDLLYANSFPLLFLTCRKFPSTGSLSKPFVSHLMNQFDGRFARNQQFLFLAFNQRVRHSNLRSVTARVRSGHQYVQKFQDMMSQPGIIDELKHASEKPKADESKKLMAKILPIIKLAGQKSEYGPIARSECISKITAMVRLEWKSIFFMEYIFSKLLYYVKHEH